MFILFCRAFQRKNSREFWQSRRWWDLKSPLAAPAPVPKRTLKQRWLYFPLLAVHPSMYLTSVYICIAFRVQFHLLFLILLWFCLSLLAFFPLHIQSSPVKPKRPISAMFIFAEEKRPKLQQERPDLSDSELTRLLARMWNDLSDKKKVTSRTKQTSSLSCWYVEQWILKNSGCGWKLEQPYC